MKQYILTSCVLLVLTYTQEGKKDYDKQAAVTAEDTIAKIQNIKRWKFHIIRVNDAVQARKNKKADSLQVKRSRHE